MAFVLKEGFKVKNFKLEALLQGNTFKTSEKGNSMSPLIKSGQIHTLMPCDWQDVKKGDIVYCKVKGKFYTHLVKAKNIKRGVQIGNNHGHTNGWTKQVYGIVIDIEK